MTIKGLNQDGETLPRAGIIRLGYKTRYCTNQQCKHKLAWNDPDTTTCPRCKGEMGKQTTAESSHFILKDAPGVAEALKTDCPTELKVFFPFDEIERNFLDFRKLYSASSLVCQGDGEYILYATNPQTGQVTVKDGVCVRAFSERMADGKQITHNIEDKMPCPAWGTPGIYAKCEHCRPRGILLVMLEQVPRMAYFQISTGSIVNLGELPQQMRNVQNIVYELTGKRKLSGIPFILRRVARSMSPLKKDSKGNPTGRVRVDKYVLQLEIEPEYMLRLIRARRRLVDPLVTYALPHGQLPKQDDVIDSPIAIEPPQWEAYPTDEAEFYEEEPEEPASTAAPEPTPAPDTEPKPEPAQPANGKAKKERPLAPTDLYDGLRRRAEGDDGKPATKAQQGLVAGKLEECFAPDKDAKGKRLTVLHFLWGIESAKELTFKQAKVTLDWLLSGEADSGGDHRLHPAAPTEAKQVYHEALKAAGQMEMPAVEPAEEKPLPEWLQKPEEDSSQLGMFGESELDEYFPRSSGVTYPD